MKIQGFRGNCDSQGKLGMCSSLAEPDSGGIPRRTSLRENGLQRPAKGGSTPAFACGSYHKLLFFSIVYSIIKKAASKYIALLAALSNHKQFSYKLSNTIVA